MVNLIRSLISRGTRNCHRKPNTLPPKESSTSRVFLQSVKIFVEKSRQEWQTLNDRGRGKVVGKVIWVNTREEKIEKLFHSIENPSNSRGLKGWHCPWDVKDMQSQAMNNKDGKLDSRTNKHNEGLYVGSAKHAQHFTGATELIFKIASTSKYGRNDDYGTNTYYVIPGTGEEYCLRIHEINKEYLDFIYPYIHEAFKKSIYSGFKKAKEHFEQHKPVK